jgi:hypothetical protein
MVVMRFEFFQVVAFIIAFAAPLVLGFSAKELFRGMAYGGGVAFLGMLVLALLFDGWHDVGNATLQKLFLNSMEVVPVATLLAGAGYMCKRLLMFVRQDHQQTG